MQYKYIKGKNITDSWIAVVEYLFKNRNEAFNIVVQIKNPIELNDKVKCEYERFCKKYNLLNIHQISYTIFPDTLYKNVAKENADKLFELYNKNFNRIKTSWGTYFNRMIYWPYYNRKNKKVVYINQLKEIIFMLNKRNRIYRTPYFITISSPNVDLKKPFGGPCLNYIALQLDRNDKGKKIINLLAVYRNHNFIERAFGNYIGLGQLLNFICKESNYNMGYLTCISSHAYISTDKRNAKKGVMTAIKELIEKVKKYESP